MVLVYQNNPERMEARHYCTFSNLSVMSNVFEKLIDDKLVRHFEKSNLLTEFQYGVRVTYSTSNLLTGVTDSIVRTFNFFCVTLALALDISKIPQTQVLWRIWQFVSFYFIVSY